MLWMSLSRKSSLPTETSHSKALQCSDPGTHIEILRDQNAPKIAYLWRPEACVPSIYIYEIIIRSHQCRPAISVTASRLTPNPGTDARSDALYRGERGTRYPARDLHCGSISSRAVRAIGSRCMPICAVVAAPPGAADLPPVTATPDVRLSGAAVAS